MEQNDNIRNNNESSKKRIFEQIIIGVIISISPFIIQLAYETISNVNVSIFLAQELIGKYEDAYNYALDIKYKEYDNEKDKQKKIQIKEKIMDKFEQILSEELCNDIEESLFDSNYYDDLKDYEYKFEYIDKSDGKKNLKVNDEEDTLELIKPYYYKIDRLKNEKIGPIYSYSRIYKVEKKGLWPGRYILSKRFDTSDRDK